MSTRLRRVTRQRGLITLIVLAALAVIVRTTVFSGASFTFATRNPGTTVTAGTYWFRTDNDGAVIINATGLRPGMSQEGTLTVTGHEDLDAAYSLTRTIVSDASSLAPALNLKVDDVTVPTSPVTCYDDTVANLTTAGLGTITTATSRTFRFTLTYLTGQALPSHQGATFSATLHTTGVAP